MEKFDMAKFLADAGVSADPDCREQIEYIRLDLIDGDPNNFYQLSGIEDLAANIALCGLQQPVRVREKPEGRYVTVSGHRRRAALELLAKDDPERWQEIPCIVERDAVSPALQQLRLIYANANTRTMTSAELGEQAAQVEKLLYQLKEEGYEFPGRMRDHVAQAVNASKTKLARLKVIRDGLNSFWRPLWDSGKIRESVAYELARIASDRQYMIYLKFGKSDKHLSDLTSDAVETYNSRLERIEKINCKKRNSVCTNKYNMQKKALEVSRWYQCECKQCCSNCSEIVSCKYVCIQLRDKQQKLRKEKQERSAQKEREAEERDRPNVEFIRNVYSRFGSAMISSGLTIDTLPGKIILPYARGKVERMISGSEGIGSNDRLPFGCGFYLSDAKAICDAADVLGCSIDYLLGREDSVSNMDTKPIEQNVSNSGTWHTGNPPEPGWYICRIEVEGMEKPMYLKYWFGGKTWQGLMEDIQTVTHWVPVVEENE